MGLIDQEHIFWMQKKEEKQHYPQGINHPGAMLYLPRALIYARPDIFRAIFK